MDGAQVGQAGTASVGGMAAEMGAAELGAAGRGHAPDDGTPAARMAAWDWPGLHAEVDRRGAALTPVLLTPAECASVSALYEREDLFRSTVVMARHGYGDGEYRYFADPLPRLVADLRAAAYAGLAPLARAWASAIGIEHPIPGTLAEFRGVCAAAGQTRPTPLLLRYAAGGWNALHRDIYGDVVFPLQIAILLSEPDRDFAGGDFLLVEQRPRMQSRGESFRLAQGQGIIFATRDRPVTGRRGTYRVAVRHGVSTVTRGRRTTLGLIFHDAA